MTQHSEFSSGYDEGFEAGVDIGKQDGIRELLAALYAEIAVNKPHGMTLRDLRVVMDEYRARYPQPETGESEDDHA